MDSMCKWEKTIKGYITLCGHTPKQMGRGWNYCPLCGKELIKDRANYLHDYYKNHKEKNEKIRHYNVHRSYGKCQQKSK